MFQVPVSPAEFTPTTAWVAERNKQFVNVYAGSEAQDAQQGELVVWVVDVETGMDIVARVPFPTPEKIGALTLTQVTGDVVSFTAVNHQGSFNLTTHQYTIS